MNIFKIRFWSQIPIDLYSGIQMYFIIAWDLKLTRCELLINRKNG